MTYHPSGITRDQTTLPKLPSWVTSGVCETTENVAFLSGAALGMLDALLRDDARFVPLDLLANTLALKAAVATSKIEGRMARESDIRDAYHLTPPGDDGLQHWGPDGEMLDFWRKVARIRFKRSDWQDGVEAMLPDEVADRVPDWIVAGQAASAERGPLAGAAHLLEAVLSTDRRSERFACALADIVLADFLGWDRPLPLTVLHITKSMCRELADGEGDAKLATRQALLNSIIDTVRLTHRLAERALALRSVAPKLRSKGSDAAVELFLKEDVVVPSTMLAPTVRGSAAEMSPRAARRFCDRLVELGVAKERTGRDSFRLYGIAP